MINRLTIFNYLTAGGLLFTPCSYSDPYSKMKCVCGQVHLRSAYGCYWVYLAIFALLHVFSADNKLCCNLCETRSIPTNYHDLER